MCSEILVLLVSAGNQTQRLLSLKNIREKGISFDLFPFSVFSEERELKTRLF